MSFLESLKKFSKWSAEQAKKQKLINDQRPIVIITKNQNEYSRAMNKYLGQGYQLVSDIDLEKKKYSMAKGATLGVTGGVIGTVLSGGLLGAPLLLAGALSGGTTKAKGKRSLVFQKPPSIT